MVVPPLRCTTRYGRQQNTVLGMQCLGTCSWDGSKRQFWSSGPRRIRKRTLLGAHPLPFQSSSSSSSVLGPPLPTTWKNHTSDRVAWSSTLPQPSSSTVVVDPEEEYGEDFMEPIHELEAEDELPPSSSSSSAASLRPEETVPPIFPPAVVVEDEPPHHSIDHVASSSFSSDQPEMDETEVETYLHSRGITSRPKPNGNWNVQNPLKWAKDFGRRSQDTKEKLDPLIRLGPGDDGYFDVTAVPAPPNVTIVRTTEQAQIVLQQLFSAHSQSMSHACDTEVMEIDIKQQGPVGNGYVTCLSMYAGPDFDYGLGDGPGTTLWIDNLDDACGILMEFKDWLEDDRFLKVWHNVGFDRHVLWNEGIDVQGFGGDTMHMARLQNTSRIQYSLERLTTLLLANPEEQTSSSDQPMDNQTSTADGKTSGETADDRKTNMKEIFGVPKKRKDGTDGKVKLVPPVEVLQRDPAHRTKWIEYSAKDARMTWELRRVLKDLLSGRQLSDAFEDKLSYEWIEDKTMWDYYWMHMRPFGQVLTDMERRGIRVDAKDYLASVEQTARQDRHYHESTFRNWVASLYPPEKRAHGLALNPASSAQLQTFLFGGCKTGKTGQTTLETRRIFTVPRTEIPQEALDAHEEQLERERQEQEGISAQQNGASRFENGFTLPRVPLVCLTILLCFVFPHYYIHSDELSDFDKTIAKLNEKLQNSKVAELKQDCKHHRLKVSGKKSELQARLLEHFIKSLKTQTQEQENEPKAIKEMSDKDLKDALTAYSIRVVDGCPREEMEKEYKQQMKLYKGLMGEYDSPAEVAGAMADIARKSGTMVADYLESRPAEPKPPPKHFELEVISLQELMKEKSPNGQVKALEPTKQTVGGSPSVTADVLRKLAGDPFADPPKRGEVRRLSS